MSATARRALLAQQTGETFISLLEIEAPGLEEPIRVCNDGADIQHGGNTYQHFPFSITLPPESDAKTPRVQLEIDGADGRIAAAIRQVAAPVTATLSIVLASSPDVVEAGPLRLSLVGEVRFDEGMISAPLSFESVLDEPYPTNLYTPSAFRSLF